MDVLENQRRPDNWKRPDAFDGRHASGTTDRGHRFNSDGPPAYGSPLMRATQVNQEIGGGVLAGATWRRPCRLLTQPMATGSVVYAPRPWISLACAGPHSWFHTAIGDRFWLLRKAPLWTFSDDGGSRGLPKWRRLPACFTPLGTAPRTGCARFSGAVLTALWVACSRITLAPASLTVSTRKDTRLHSLPPGAWFIALANRMGDVQPPYYSFGGLVDCSSFGRGRGGLMALEFWDWPSRRSLAMFGHSAALFPRQSKPVGILCGCLPRCLLSQYVPTSVRR